MSRRLLWWIPTPVVPVVCGIPCSTKAPFLAYPTFSTHGDSGTAAKGKNNLHNPDCPRERFHGDFGRPGVVRLSVRSPAYKRPRRWGYDETMPGQSLDLGRDS